jgi:3-oxoacid CoA-transferase B subunit
MSEVRERARGLTRRQIARRVAAELGADWVVNVGIGMPTMVPPFVTADQDIIFHSENGIIGMGPEIEDPDEVDNDLLSAGKRPVTMAPGGAFVDHADSFALARGGRLDVTVLGAFQVAENGDLANWKLPGAGAGNIGGAMDLARGARRVYAMMNHVTKEGEPKLVASLTYPATAFGVTTKVFTDLAVVAIGAQGFELEEVAPGVTVEDVRRATGAELRASGQVKRIAV